MAQYPSILMWMIISMALKTKMAMVTLMTKIESVDRNVWWWDPQAKVDDDYDDQNDKDDVDDKMIESVDRNVSWDPHVLSCRPPCKGQGEEEGGGAGHDDDDDADDEDEDDDDDDGGDNNESGIGNDRSGSSSGEICPPAVLTPLEALTPDQTNVIGCSEPSICI